MVEKAKNFLGDFMNGGVNNVSLLSARSKLNTSKVNLASPKSNVDDKSQQSFDSNSRKNSTQVLPQLKTSSSNVRSKFFKQPSLEDEEEEEEAKAMNVSRVSNAKTVPQKKVSQIGLNRLESQNQDYEGPDEKDDLAKIIMKKQRSSALQPLKIQTLNLLTTKND